MGKTREAYIGSCEQRAFDVVAAASTGIAISPLVGVAAVALGIELRTPRMIFRQRRIGKGGQPFDLFKLRTKPGQNYDGSSELGGSEHPDASKLGKFVRKVGVDESLQSINVLLGDLHFVGVRTQIPITREQRYEADAGLYREWEWWADLNPGVIGPGQSLAHNHAGAYTENSALIQEVMRLDIAGCEQASLRNDTICWAGTPLSIIRSAVLLLQSNREAGQVTS